MVSSAENPVSWLQELQKEVKRTSRARPYLEITDSAGLDGYLAPAKLRRTPGADEQKEDLFVVEDWTVKGQVQGQALHKCCRKLLSRTYGCRASTLEILKLWWTRTGHRKLHRWTPARA